MQSDLRNCVGRVKFLTMKIVPNILALRFLGGSRVERFICLLCKANKLGSNYSISFGPQPPHEMTRKPSIVPPIIFLTSKRYIFLFLSSLFNHKDLSYPLLSNTLKYNNILLGMNLACRLTFYKKTSEW